MFFLGIMHVLQQLLKIVLLQVFIGIAVVFRRMGLIWGSQCQIKPYLFRGRVETCANPVFNILRNGLPSNYHPFFIVHIFETHPKSL